MAGVDVGSLVLQLSADVKRFEKAMKTAQGVTNKAMREVERRVRQTDKNLDNHFKNMGRRAAAAFGAIGAALGVRELANMADQWSDLNARLTLATGSTHAGADAMERLNEVARRSYSSLDTTVESFISNSTALRELGYNTQQQLDYTEALNNALVISGAKGDRAKTVMNALSKAMALGKLSGVNLNTVISQGGRVAEALADSMGVTVNQLRKLGEEGKITDKELFGITSQMSKLNKELDSMENTIQDGFTLIKNALLTYVGTADQATAISGTLAQGLVIIADNFNVFGDATLMVASLIASTLIGRSIIPLIKRAMDAKVAIGGLITAMRQAQTLSASIGAIMSGGALLGGVAGLAAGGIALTYLHYAHAAAEAERNSAKLHEEWRKMGLITAEVEEGVDKASKALDEFTEAGRIRRLKAIADEMGRIRGNGYMFDGSNGNVGDLIKGVGKLNAEKGTVEGEAKKEVLEWLKLLRDFPSEAGNAAEALKKIQMRPGTSKELFDLIQQAIALTEAMQAAEIEFQSFDRSFYIENANKQLDNLKEKLLKIAMNERVAKEVERLVEAFRKGEMSARDFETAIRNMAYLPLSGKILDWITAIADGFSNASVQAENLSESANKIKEQRETKEGLTQEQQHLNYFQGEYSKKQDEINAKTRKQLELERKIAEEKRGYEKDYGEGTAEFIPDELWADRANKSLAADKRRSEEGKRPRENEFESITKRLQERTEALRQETAIRASLNPLVNDYGYAVNKAMTARQMWNAAVKAGVTEKDGVAEAIEQIAEAYALADVEGQKLKETQDELRSKLEEVQQTAKDMMRGFIDDLIAGKSATEALGNALTKLGNKLIDSGLNMMLDNIFKGNGSGGGIGGFFAGLFRADGGEIRRYPNGKITGKGSSRSDSIPTMLSNGEFVINAAATKKYRALLEQINNGGLLARADGGIVGGNLTMPHLPSPRYLQSLKDRKERSLRVDVTPSPLFDVKVTEITDGRIAQTAPTIVTQAVKQSDARFARNFHESRVRSMM